MIRAKLLIEPESIEGLKVLLSHTYDNREYGDNISNFEPTVSFDDRTTFSDIEFADESEINLSFANISYEISDELTVSSITTYDKTKRFRFRDGDYSAASVARAC